MTAFEITAALLICILWSRVSAHREELSRLRGVVRSHDELVKRVHSLEDAHAERRLDFDFVHFGGENTNGRRRA